MGRRDFAGKGQSEGLGGDLRGEDDGAFEDRRAVRIQDEEMDEEEDDEGENKAGDRTEEDAE